MPAVLLTIEDQNDLAGMPALCWPLYVEFRKRMDYKTGRAGAGAGQAISWQAMREALYQEPHCGIPQVYPSKEAVRRLARWLERKGMLVFQSNPASGRLIVYLPKAHTQMLARKQADRDPTGAPDRGLHRENTHQADRGVRPQADTHRVTGISPLTTTSTDNTVETLRWPPSATAEEKALVNRARLNGLSQAVVDEFAGALQKGAVRERTPYLAKLIERAMHGDFVRDKGKSVQAARERASNRESNPRATPDTPPMRSAAAEELRERNKRRKS